MENNKRIEISRNIKRKSAKDEKMQHKLPVSPVLHTEVTASIGLKTSFRVGTSIPQIFRCSLFRSPMYK